MNIKLQNILLQMANDVLDLPKTNDPIGKPIDEAAEAILDLLDKSLPMLKMAEYSMNGQRCIIDENIGWNNAIEAVRKVIKEEL